MGIKSTKEITRKDAIKRIKEIIILIKKEYYFDIENNVFEPDNDIIEFMNNWVPINISTINQWTNKMLANYMDKPFFRFSMFDNYLIKE